MILEFIKGFEKVQDHFLNGYCYHFAVILNDVFPGGQIGYDQIAGHFMYLYNNKYYDVSGEVKVINSWILYSKLYEYDYLLANRVYNQCILKQSSLEKENRNV